MSIIKTWGYSMYIDKNKGLEYVGGIERIYLKLCSSFLKRYENFEEEMNNCNEEEIFYLIHNLKAISLNLGAVRLYEITKGNKYDNYEVFIDTFNKTYQEIKKAME